MNSLERSDITKAGYDHGWEHIDANVAERVVMSSALHTCQVEVTSRAENTDDMARVGTKWRVVFAQTTLAREVARIMPTFWVESGVFYVTGERELGQLLRSAANMARSLPDAPEVRFEKTVAEEIAQSGIIRGTEAERVIRQRIGQDIFRESLMDYWGGACAVTGIAVPELLRASHIKPWAECETDSDRLNVFNGLLLCAHIDALFDRHLITFDESGTARFAPQINAHVRATLGLSEPLRLRWLRQEHEPFLAQHRQYFETLASTNGLANQPPMPAPISAMEKARLRSVSFCL